MANKDLFRSLIGALFPAAQTTNEAGGVAYALSDEHALAQYAATGCLNSTFYATAEEQLDTVLKLCEKVEPEFVARAAVYARTRGYMKDLPALLCAILSARDSALLERVFCQVIDSPRMLRNFVQIVRSGVVGRKSLGTRPKRLVLKWLESRSDVQLFTGSVGQSPLLADVVKMVHPRPTSKSRESLYGYMIGCKHDESQLPEVVRRYEQYKQTSDRSDVAVPDVPFQMLTALDLGSDGWTAIARRASWQATRMNLNTFLRHGVFDDLEVTEMIAERLRDRQAIAGAKVFPYQLMVAYMCADAGLPKMIHEALQDAMEISLDNVPVIEGKVYVFPDVSGSMQSPVTGNRKGSTTAVRCVDVAALVAAAILRRNKDAEVIPFSDHVVPAALNPRDSVMTNARKLASLPSGGTNCSAPLTLLNKKKLGGDLLVYVSDNQSWVDSPCGSMGRTGTETMKQWAAFKVRNPRAKMVCIDIQPYGSSQVKERPDVLNIGGFSDHVFDCIADMARNRVSADYWVNQIKAVALAN